MSWVSQPVRRTGVTSVVLFLLLVGCDKDHPVSVGPVYSDRPRQNSTPVYVLAVHPLYNPAKLANAYQPLINYLNANLPGNYFELEASRDYQSYEAKIRTRKVSLLLPNPWQTLEAMKVGYSVVVEAGASDDFRGIFVARRDRKIKSPADLRGEVVSYPSPTALAACILPQYFLHKHGIDVNKDLRNRYVGSQESAILHAYLGQAAAAATWPPPWRAFQKDHPEEAAQLKVIWKTRPLVNNAVMARDDVPPEVVNQLRRLLLRLSQTVQGQEILQGMETARFNPATNESYVKVQRFILQFEREVRSVELKH